MYEDIIDWVALSELIGVIPSALLKMAFIWLMPLLVLFGLYVIYSLVRRVFYAKRLRKYSVKASDAITLPDFYARRVHDDKNVVSTIAALIILLFFSRF